MKTALSKLESVGKLLKERIEGEKTMICANCGRQIPEGQQTCSYCDPVINDSHEMKSANPIIRKDTLECPSCSMTDISPKERSCPNCGTRFVNDPWLCRCCNTYNQYNTLHCAHCGRIKGTRKDIPGGEDNRMKFYYYLIYFGFFASAVINFVLGWFIVESDSLRGIYMITYACLIFVVRFLMAGRKKIGVNIYLGMLAVDGILSAISAYSLLDDFSDNTEAMLMQYGLNHLFEVSADDLKMMYLIIMIFGYAVAALLVGITFKIFTYFIDRHDFFDR